MFTSKHLVLFLLLSAFSQISLAQFQFVPLQNQEVSKKSAARVSALSLPFFDDFSNPINSPNQRNWIKGSGVSINNNSGINPPTLNVATFDGLKANGIPYNFTDVSANGGTDTLTSQSIDLSKIVALDSLALNFFYQSQGLGDASESNDSLIVQFLTNGGKWETVFIAKDGKHIIGKDTTKLINNTSFTQVLFPVSAQIYLHAAFQIRFIAYGRQSGQFDVWHIDYVYLDKISSRGVENRSIYQNKKLYFNDFAYRNSVSSIFKRYSTMPMSQLKNNAPTELSETIVSNINNLFSNNRNITAKYFIQNVITQKVLSDTIKLPNPSIAVNADLKIETKNTLGSYLTGDKAILKIKFQLDDGTGIRQNPLFKANDTISRTVEIDNYYAYDDGTAEQGAYLKKGFGRVAVQYILNKADAVTAIRINLQKSLIDLTGNTISLQVMSDKDGKPDKILGGLSSKIKYADTQNGFIEYKLDSVTVVGTFYVAYTQLSDDEPLIVGVDNNTPDFAKNHFYNISNEWVNVTKATGFTPIKGSLLIRPVMAGNPKFGKTAVINGKEELILSTESEIQDQNLLISPNPTSDIIRWNDRTLKNVEIVDMSGRSVLSENTDNQAINIGNLNAGTYILRLSNDKNTFVRKIVKL